MVTDADAQGLVDTTKKYLVDLGLSCSRLRGQKLIKDMCESPVPFVHCASHNLNLVINDAVEGVAHNEKFFNIMQEIFNFFDKSLNRW